MKINTLAVGVRSLDPYTGNDNDARGEIKLACFMMVVRLTGEPR